MKTSFPKYFYSLAVIVLALFAFLMSAHFSRVVFERMPHLEDEVAYHFQAQVFARGQLVIDSPSPRMAFWRPFLIDREVNGQEVRSSKYTPGWSMALALGIAMGQGWVINAFFAMLAVALVYRISADIFGRDTGLIASVLVAFSPAALLLNATLMAHTVAFCYGLFFIWAYMQIEKGQHVYRWAIAGGIVLGMMLLTRPASTVAIALPFVAWSGVKALQVVSRSSTWREGILLVFNQWKPLIVLAVLTLSISRFNNFYTDAATGDPNQNMYTMIWSYDRIGFGECCGRSGHTLEKAFRHARFDMSLAAADLFGLQVDGWLSDQIPEILRIHLTQEADFWEPFGLSFMLLPFGMAIGLLWGATRKQARIRLAWLAVWLLGAIVWCVAPVRLLPQEIITNPISAWAWIILGLAWIFMPLLVLARKDYPPQVIYTWLFVAVVLGLVVFQMTYWIGSQRYSTRYWYESVGMLAMLTALPLASLMQTRLQRYAIYGMLSLLMMHTFFQYSVPRIGVLYQFNNVSQAWIDQLLARRVDNRPILLLVHGDDDGDNRVSWRAFGSFLHATSPFLDSEIVVARVHTNNDTMREAVVSQFPDHQIIEANARATDFEFIDP
jgi:hypothetical protein